MSQVKVVDQKKGRRAFPAVGFVLMVACGVIAYFTAPHVVNFIDRNMTGFNIRGVLEDQTELAVGIVIFFILIAFCALLVSALSPRKAINIKETDLIKEREEAQRRKKLEKARQRQVNREYRQGDSKDAKRR